MRAVEALVADGDPGTGYSYAALAAEAYGTEAPTAAQLSATRRAVSRLASQGVVRKVQFSNGMHGAARPRESGRDVLAHVLFWFGRLGPGRAFSIPELT